MFSKHRISKPLVVDVSDWIANGMLSMKAQKENLAPNTTGQMSQCLLIQLLGILFHQVMPTATEEKLNKISLW